MYTSIYWHSLLVHKLLLHFMPPLVLSHLSSQTYFKLLLIMSLFTPVLSCHLLFFSFLSHFPPVLKLNYSIICFKPPIFYPCEGTQWNRGQELWSAAAITSTSFLYCKMCPALAFCLWLQQSNFCLLITIDQCTTDASWDIVSYRT